MDRLKKFWKENEDWFAPVVMYSSIAIAAVAVLQTRKANGNIVESCDLFTTFEGKHVIATHHRNGSIETWTNPDQ
jgi:predicted negative regulator of RcsB-dependent stress response